MTTEFVQTRSEKNGLTFNSSVVAAMDRAKKDPTIWKISWTNSWSQERIRLVRQVSPMGDIWVYEPLLDSIKNMKIEPKLDPNFSKENRPKERRLSDNK